MIRKFSTMAKAIVVCLALASAGGCLAAAAGAGAAGGIYLTQQGASGIVNGSIEDVAGRVPGILADLGVGVTGESTQRNGAEREWNGSRGELGVRVKLTRESTSTTRVDASARKSPVEWDKDFARTIVQRIVSGR